MSAKPILVVHGIANHEKYVFEHRVAVLQSTIRTRLPDVQLIPVFWGDLGGRSEDIRDSLPQLKNGQWSTRAEGVLSINDGLVNVRSETEFNNEYRARIMTRSSTPRDVTPDELDAITTTIATALGHTTHLQKINDAELLKAVGVIVNEALGEDSARASTGLFEVRGALSGLETRGWIVDKVTSVISEIDKLVGTLVEDRLGTLIQRLRASLMNGVAATLGDIVAYHSNKEQIQQRLWDAINQHAPGYGTQARPIGLIAHSLGGVISFDMMVAPANGTPLYVDSFVSFGSQPAFFEIMDPRVAGTSYISGQPIELPATIKKWFNLWNVVDLLAFTAGTVFRLSDGSKPEDIAVRDPISVMLDEKLWLHSIYWRTPELLDAIVRGQQ